MNTEEKKSNWLKENWFTVLVGLVAILTVAVIAFNYRTSQDNAESVKVHNSNWEKQIKINAKTDLTLGKQDEINRKVNERLDNHQKRIEDLETAKEKMTDAQEKFKADLRRYKSKTNKHSKDIDSLKQILGGKGLHDNEGDTIRTAP